MKETKEKDGKEEKDDKEIRKAYEERLKVQGTYSLKKGNWI